MDDARIKSVTLPVADSAELETVAFDMVWLKDTQELMSRDMDGNWDRLKGRDLYRLFMRDGVTTVCGSVRPAKAGDAEIMDTVLGVGEVVCNIDKHKVHIGDGRTYGGIVL